MKKLSILGLFLFGTFAYVGVTQAANLVGHIDEVSSSGVIRGWATDKELLGRHLLVHVYFDGVAGSGKLVAGGSTTLARCDVKLTSNDCGFGYGYEMVVPPAMRDGKTHKVYIYVISEDGKSSKLLQGSPKSFVVKQDPNIRHERGSVVIHQGTVYYLGEALRYPFPSAAVFLSWGHKFNKIAAANTADIAMPMGDVVEMKQADKIAVVSPNGGEIVSLGSTQMVRWTDNNFDPNLNSYTLHVTRADGGSYGIIANGLKTNSYSWNVGEMMGTSVKLATGSDYYIQVVKQGSASGLVDQSDAPFTIKGDINSPEVTRDTTRLLNAIILVDYVYEYYTKNNSVYPTLNELEIGLGKLSAPTPADGSCSESDNAYVYTLNADRKDFTFKFCLGTDSFIKQAADVGLTLYKGINIWDHAFVLKMVAIDQQNHDARRLSDIRQMQTALELYYDGNNGYPVSLSAISPLYLKTLPIAPTPAEGSCTSEQNNYNYQQLNNGRDYRLTFCLGKPSGNYGAGIRSASSLGIQ